MDVTEVEMLFAEFLEHLHPSRALDPQALRVTTRLFDAERLADDWAWAVMFGQLHWLRYELLPEGPDERDRDLAAMFFFAAARSSPGPVPGVPAPVREAIDRVGAGAIPLLDALAYRVSCAQALLLQASEDPRPAGHEPGIELLAHAVVDAGADPRAPTWWSDLSAAFRSRFARSGEIADLERSVRASRVSVVRGQSHGDAVRRRAHHCAALAMLYEVTGDDDLREEAVRVGREAIADPTGGGVERALALSTLGALLSRLAEQSADPELLDEIVDLHIEALDLAPEETAEHLYGVVAANVVQGISIRFELTGDSRGVTAGEELALAELNRPGAPPDLREALWNALISVRAAMYQRGRDPAALDAMLHASRNAAAELAQGARAPMMRLNVAIALAQHFELHHGRPEFDEAVGILRDLRASGVDDPTVDTTLAHLLIEDSPAALDEAEAAIRAAVDATPETHPARCLRLYTHALVNHRLHERDGDPRRLARSAELFRAAAEVVAGPPAQRCAAAMFAAEAAEQAGDRPAAAREYAHAVDLLPLLAGRGVPEADRFAQVARLAGLGGEAAAAALAVGDPDTALELIESGRGVLLSRSLETRSEVTDLERAHPDLAREFHRLRDLVDPAAPVTGGRHRLGAAWERLLARIRREPGFARFLRRPAAADLVRAGDAGPVVVVTTGRRRADALVLHEGRLDVVPLPGLTEAELLDHGPRFRLAVDPTGAAPRGPEAARDLGAPERREDMSDALAWLWDAVAEPVLRHLGLLDGPPRAHPPRLWWVPTGGLALLPLHAAGRPGQPGVLDRVVSSYAPTVASLLRGRRNRPDRPIPAGRVLVVGLADGYAGPPLPDASAEAATVAGLVGPGCALLRDGAADRERVLAALPRADCVHFACHGVGDPLEPHRGELVLADGPLTIAEIGELRRDGGGLAVLSACGTASSAAVPDEAVHLAGAFNLAGYTHVVATLWPVLDAVAARAAARLHEQLQAGGVDPRLAHLAVHRIQHELRAEHPDRPAVWASHVHLGP